MDSVGAVCGNRRTKMLIPKMKFDYIYALYVHCEGLLKAFCCLKIIIFKCFFNIFFVLPLKVAVVIAYRILSSLQI